MAEGLVSAARRTCYYDILQVPRTATDGDLKKAYRKLALKFHPDKNPEDSERCAQLFHDIQHAYEILSDPQERAWYDRNREEILFGAGSDFTDDTIDLMMFFSGSAYSGFGDDANGFYGVYGDLFTRISQEEAMFVEDPTMKDNGFPSFGNLASDYVQIVQPFYAFWQSFVTVRPYHWLNKYDRTQAPNRKVQKLMEKDNKKIRDQAKKKRNETVRELVKFIRKRDKRVIAYKKLLDERETIRKKQLNERKILEAKKRIEELKLNEYKPPEWETEEQFEKEMAYMQTHLDNEYGRDSSNDSDSETEDTPDLYCPACEKYFKSEKAYMNHEKSKKHKENVNVLKELLVDETKSSESDSDSEHDERTHSLNEGNEDTPLINYDHLTTEHQPQIVASYSSQEEKDSGDSSNDSSGDSNIDDQLIAAFLPKTINTTGILDEINDPVNINDQPILLDLEVKEPSESKKTKTSKRKGKKDQHQHQSDQQLDDTSLLCNTCGMKLPSRNKLYKHLDETGHALPVGNIYCKETKTKNRGRRKR